MIKKSIVFLIKEYINSLFSRYTLSKTLSFFLKNHLNLISNGGKNNKSNLSYKVYNKLHVLDETVISTRSKQKLLLNMEFLFNTFIEILHFLQIFFISKIISDFLLTKILKHLTESAVRNQNSSLTSKLELINNINSRDSMINFIFKVFIFILCSVSMFFIDVSYFYYINLTPPQATINLALSASIFFISINENKYDELGRVGNYSTIEINIQKSVLEKIERILDFLSVIWRLILIILGSHLLVILVNYLLYLFGITIFSDLLLSYFKILFDSGYDNIDSG